jgi:regulator of protease activity HflC (stomatin/prohibitin superfamily)
MSETSEDRRQQKALEKKWAAIFTVDESHAKAVMRLGAFQRFEMSWKDHAFDKDWNVIDVPGVGAGKKFTGGLHAKWPGAEKIFPYRFRWKDIQFVKDGKDITQLHEKIIDYIFLKPAYYAFEVEKAETSAAKERIPITLHVSVLLRSVNPYKTLFKGVPNWFENAATRLASMLRDLVAQKTLEEVLSFRKDPKTTWQILLKDNPIIKALEEDWGLRVEKDGLDIRGVDLPKEYEQAAARKKQLELEAEAEKTKIEIESQARAIELAGTMIQMIRQETGMPLKEIKKGLRKDPEGFLKKHNQIIDKNLDLLQRKIAIEGGSFVDIRVGGAEGIEKALLEILTAWLRMPMGQRKRERGKEEKQEKQEKQERVKVTEDDVKKVKKEYF